MPYQPLKHGRAEYSRWMQLTPAMISGITEGPDVGPLSGQVFAALSYVVNPSPVIISGDVVVDAVGIDDSGVVKVQGDQLKVYDQGVINAINNISNPAYSIVTKISGSYLWVLKAAPGTSFALSGWQASQVYTNVGGEVEVSWANGNADFVNVGSDFASLSYF